MKSKLLIIFILLLAAFLRLYRLGILPEGMTWDEPALGYNAYSILKTARDEHGTFLPLTFKSFGDYKPGLYIYLTVPAVAFFGLTEFATRLPSALAGILAVYGLYLFANQLFPDLKLKIRNYKLTIGEITATILAITPWHLYFSRMAWEANVYLTFLLFTLYFLLKALQAKSFPLYPSVILATLTLLIYQGAKLLTPLSILITLFLFHQSALIRIINFRKNSLDSAVIAFCTAFAIALFFTNLNGPAGNRLNRLSLFNYNPPLTQTKDLLHHHYDLHLRMIASRYLNHFSPEFLFYDGIFADREHLPNQGLFLISTSFLLLVGLYQLTKKLTPNSILILFITFIAPLPASMTLGDFSAVRSLFLIVPLSLIAGLGLFWLLSRKLGWLFLLILLFNSAYSIDLYFKHSNELWFKELNAFYKPAIQAIKNNPADRVILTDVYGQPYIYYLFYTAYDPQTYQQNRRFIDGGVDVGRIASVANVEFHQFNTTELATTPNTIFIGTIGNLPNSYNYSGDHIAYYQDIVTPDKKELMLRVVKTK